MARDKEKHREDRDRDRDRTRDRDHRDKNRDRDRDREHHRDRDRDHKRSRNDKDVPRESGRDKSSRKDRDRHQDGLDKRADSRGRADDEESKGSKKVCLSAATAALQLRYMPTQGATMQACYARTVLLWGYFGRARVPRPGVSLRDIGRNSAACRPLSGCDWPPFCTLELENVNVYYPRIFGNFVPKGMKRRWLSSARSSTRFLLRCLPSSTLVLFTDCARCAVVGEVP